MNVTVGIDVTIAQHFEAYQLHLICKMRFCPVPAGVVIYDVVLDQYDKTPVAQWDGTGLIN